jgi:hypothetical protein
MAKACGVQPTRVIRALGQNSSRCSVDRGAHAFLSSAVPERGTGQIYPTDGDQADRRVDAAASFSSPIHVLQIDEQG